MGSMYMLLYCKKGMANPLEEIRLIFIPKKEVWLGWTSFFGQRVFESNT